MTTTDLPITDLALPDWNPRKITEHDFQGLVESIKADPDFLKARPIIVNTRSGQNVVIAGNMRIRACQHLGYATIPCILVDLDSEQEKRWALKDNIHQGRWDIDLLVNFDDQLFDAPGIDIADMLKGDSGEAATTEEGKCSRCEELRKAVDGHERRAGHMVHEKELADLG
jgi:ParB-like chromosome segregation protein Spo0J